MTTTTITPGTGQTVNLPPPDGRAAAASSRPVTLATEDKGVLDLVATSTLQGALTETAPASDTASSGLNGRLQRLAQRITALIALLPVSLGQKASAASLAIVVASDQSNVPVKALLGPGVARQLTTAATTANTTLTTGIKGVSIYSRSSDARFSIGTGAQTATATSHYIASGERIDFDVSGLASPAIAIIFGPAAVVTILEVSELN